MSTFSQFVGGGTPIGTYIQANATINGPNFTAAGQEFLQTGYLKAYTSTYAPIVSVSKLLATANRGPTSTTFTGGYNTNYGQNFASSAFLSYTSGATTYYFLINSYNGGGSQPVYYGSNLSGSSTLVTNTISNNSVMIGALSFNNKILTSIGNNSPSADEIYLWTAGAYSLVTSFNAGAPVGYKMVASPSLLVLVRGALGTASGDVRTSTDGATFTARTPSLAVTGTISRVEYFASAGLFIYVCSDGSIYTSPDGYTLTARTAPTGMPTPTAIPNYQLINNLSTSISGLAVIWITTTKFIYTTNGTSYSLVDVNDYTTNPQTWGKFTSTYMVVGNDGTRIIIGGVTQNYLAYTTNGSSWSLDFVRTGYPSYSFSATNYSPRVSTFAKIGSSTYIIPELNGSLYACDITSSIAMATPDLVGTATTLTGYGSFNSYVRIG